MLKCRGLNDFAVIVVDDGQNNQKGMFLKLFLVHYGTARQEIYTRKIVGSVICV